MDYLKNKNFLVVCLTFIFGVVIGYVFLADVKVENQAAQVIKNDSTTVSKKQADSYNKNMRLGSVASGAEARFVNSDIEIGLFQSEPANRYYYCGEGGQVSTYEILNKTSLPIQVNEIRFNNEGGVFGPSGGVELYYYVYMTPQAQGYTTASYNFSSNQVSITPYGNTTISIPANSTKYLTLYSGGTTGYNINNCNHATENIATTDRLSFSYISYQQSGSAPVFQTLNQFIFTPKSYVIKGSMNIIGQPISTTLLNGNTTVADFKTTNNFQNGGAWKKIIFYFSKPSNIEITTPKLYEAGAVVANINNSIVGGGIGSKSGYVVVESSNISGINVANSSGLDRYFSLKVNLSGVIPSTGQKVKFLIGPNPNLADSAYFTYSSLISYPKTYSQLGNFEGVIWRGIVTPTNSALWLGSNFTDFDSSPISKLYSNTTWILQ